MPACYKCGADAAGFVHDQRVGRVVCPGCGYEQARMQDQGLGVRVFANEASKKKDTTGQALERAGQQREKLKAAAAQVCAYAQIEQSVAVSALTIYEEYRKKASTVKSLKARNTDVVMAACIYCQLEFQAAGCGEQAFRLDTPALRQVRERLDEYCQGKGRGSRGSALERQLEDIARYVNFNSLRSVAAYIPEVKLQLNWPDTVANRVATLARVFQQDEQDMVWDRQLLSVVGYTALLYYLVTCQFRYRDRVYEGFMPEDQARICQLYGMSRDFMQEQAERMIDSKRQLVAQVFDQILEDGGPQGRDSVY